VRIIAQASLRLTTPARLNVLASRPGHAERHNQRMDTANPSDIAWCELHQMENCDHLTVPARNPARFETAMVRISPRGMAHFDGCSHKGDDPDYSRWAELRTPRAWADIRNGDITSVTRDDGVAIKVTGLCRDCDDSGPLV
jgi:hypothetical protein